MCATTTVSSVAWRGKIEYVSADSTVPQQQQGEPYYIAHVRQSEVAERCYAHTLQYMATNREYNNKLIVDRMYLDGKWTDSYKALLRTTWDSIDAFQLGQVHKIQFQQPF